MFLADIYANVEWFSKGIYRIVFGEIIHNNSFFTKAIPGR